MLGKIWSYLQAGWTPNWSPSSRRETDEIAATIAGCCLSLYLGKCLPDTAQKTIDPSGGSPNLGTSWISRKQRNHEHDLLTTDTEEMHWKEYVPLHNIRRIHMNLWHSEKGSAMEYPTETIDPREGYPTLSTRWVLHKARNHKHDFLATYTEECTGKNMSLYMIFVDFTKAFDIANREEIWNILRKLGCSDHFVSLISALHTERKTSVKIRELKSICSWE